MKLNFLYYTFSFFSIFTLTACDDEINPTETGSITIEFDPHAGEEEFSLNTDYINESGETFRVTKFNYYISNVSFKKTDGTVFTVNQDSSYFLIMGDHEESREITLNNIPAGDYNEITFTIGVDSLRSTMDVSKRTGVLDPGQGHDGMYWVWNSGYIFFKMEGTSPQVSAEQEHKFYYHIGGFGGFDSPTINNIRTKTISLGSARAEVRANKKPQVHLHVDVLQVFDSETTISLAEHPLVMFSEFSRTVSANYLNMFEFDHVHN